MSKIDFAREVHEKMDVKDVTAYRIVLDMSDGHYLGVYSPKDGNEIRSARNRLEKVAIVLDYMGVENTSEIIKDITGTFWKFKFEYPPGSGQTNVPPLEELIEKLDLEDYNLVHKEAYVLWSGYRDQE